MHIQADMYSLTHPHGNMIPTQSTDICVLIHTHAHMCTGRTFHSFLM